MKIICTKDYRKHVRPNPPLHVEEGDVLDVTPEKAKELMDTGHFEKVSGK